MKPLFASKIPLGDSVGPVVREAATTLLQNWCCWPVVLEALFVVALLSAVWTSRRLLRHFIEKHPLPHSFRLAKVEFSTPFFGHLPQVVPPALFLLALLVAVPWIERLTDDLRILHISQRAALIWLGWEILSYWVVDHFLRLVLTISLLPILLLMAMDLWTPVALFLDSLGVQIAGINVSVFLLMKAIFIGTCLFWLGRLVLGTGERYLRDQKQFNEETRELLVKALYFVLYFVLTLVALELIGVDLTVLAVFSGAVGVGIGLGLQKIAANFISGIILLLEHNVRIGNLIEVDGLYGWVRAMGARASVIEGLDGRELLIPNEKLITEQLINWTYSHPQARMEINLTVAYGTDLELAQTLLLEAAALHSRVVRRPAPTCYFRQFVDNGIQVSLRFWLDDIRLGRDAPVSDIILLIWKSFQQHGIRIPYPRQELNVYFPETPLPPH